MLQKPTEPCEDQYFSRPPPSPEPEFIKRKASCHGRGRFRAVTAEFRKSLDLLPVWLYRLSMERGARAVCCVVVLALLGSAHGIGDGIIRRRGLQFVDKNCREFMYSGWNR